MFWVKFSGISIISLLPIPSNNSFSLFKSVISVWSLSKNDNWYLNEPEYPLSFKVKPVIIDWDPVWAPVFPLGPNAPPWI